jgi:hypothetical protein
MGDGSMTDAVTRRGVARGAAWSVPLVAAVAAAPQAAATVCPGASFLGVIFSATQDQISVTNSGPVPWPAGTTITWVIQNVRQPAGSSAFAVGPVSGLTVGTVPASIARNASARVTFSRTTALAVGASVSWRFSLAEYRYNSRVTVSFVGTTLANCPPLTACISNRFSEIGSTCPTGGAAARVAAADANATPDPIVPRP